MFSKDKSPYKTNVGVHFRHERAKDVYPPGYYLHLDPKESFVGMGIWHPDTATQKMIREAIAENLKALKRATGGKFGKAFPLEGDSLKRPPAGFDVDHPLITDLRRKDFIVVRDLSQKELCASRKPSLKFITEAVGMKF